MGTDAHALRPSEVQVDPDTSTSPLAPLAPSAISSSPLPASAPPAPLPPPQFHNSAINQNITNVAVNVGGPNILITTKRAKVPFILRAVWFVCIGSWLSLIFIMLGFFFSATIIGLPLGFWFINRVPQAQTLRLRSTEFKVREENGFTHISEEHAEQLPWYYRALYFPIGLVFGFVWSLAAWAIAFPIITLPLSVWMVDRIPTVVTLQRH